MRYHINPNTGQPGACKARIACPFGSPDEHYGSKEDAMAGYESMMSGSVIQTHTREDQASAEASRSQATMDKALDLSPKDEDTLEQLHRKLARVNGMATQDSTSETFIKNTETIFALQTAINNKKSGNTWVAYKPDASNIVGEPAKQNVLPQYNEAVKKAKTGFSANSLDNWPLKKSA